MAATRRALLSVSDKTGLVELGVGLVENGFELIASGGTARTLREAGLAVISVSDVTGFPELLGGRVKTLHPAIHGGILAQRTEGHLAELDAEGLSPIDVVVCNLYPFVKTVADPNVTFEEAIEQIDIGGVTLLRAAAKNCAHVTIVCDPADYVETLAIIGSGDETETWRRRMAKKAFAQTAAYDVAISGWFAKETDIEDAPDALPARLSPIAERDLVLRYGENPHQEAALYAWTDRPLPFKKLQGKALSYNNLVDLDGAWAAIDAFTAPTVAIIKHTNPCGLAVGENLVEAFGRALESDPVSAFGSIIAVNRTVDVALLDAIGKLFVEVLAAPAFTEDALAWLARRKKNCRAVELTLGAEHGLQLRTIRGALLAQTYDDRDVTTDEWTVPTAKKPTEAQMADLALAWRAAKAVKSNAIIFVKGNATVGVGAGQMNRLESVQIAARQAGEKAHGAVLASDAFFPFADGIEAAAAAGIVAVAQPGGSIRDAEVIAAADRLGVAMVFTGVRHFKH